MQLHYEITTTFLSMIPGVFASAVAFYFVSRRQRTGLQIVSGSLLLGLGIGAVHYLGMAAMRLDGYIQYDPVRFTVSLVVAALLASLALVIRSTAPPFRFSRILLSASVMGIAIAGMHYVAMSSAYFIKGTNGPSPAMSLRKGDELAITVTLVTGLWILLLTVIAAAIVTGTARQLRASEYALQRRSRSLAMLSAGNRTLVRSDDEQELLQKMCAVVVETGDYPMAWIGYKVDDEEKSVRAMASIGFEDDYLARIKIDWDNGEEGRDPTGKAIRTGKTQISRTLKPMRIPCLGVIMHSRAATDPAPPYRWYIEAKRSERS